MSETGQPTGWSVQLDPERCTRCEACARDCPTGALSLGRDEETLSLLFDSSLCHGCPDSEGCQGMCPENAIRLLETEADDAGKSVLLCSPLAKCSGCHKTFAAAQKLETLSRKGQVHHELIRNLCPVCRREQLVVTFIQDQRVPGSTAEYRSTKQILRKAGKLREDAR
jgi:ferredoxin